MVRSGPGCKFVRCEPVETRVGAVHIVVDPPVFDAVSGMPIAGEEPLVETLVAHPSVEVFHEAVLHRLARRDVGPFNMPAFLPRQNGIRGQLSAIVRHDHAGVAAMLDDDVEFAGDTLARDRVVDDGRQALPAEVVDDAQDPEAAAVG